MTPRLISKFALKPAAVLLALALGVATAEANPKLEAGSRGAKTSVPPPPTRTSPAQAKPLKPLMGQQPAAQTAAPQPPV